MGELRDYFCANERCDLLRVRAEVNKKVPESVWPRHVVDAIIVNVYDAYKTMNDDILVDFIIECDKIVESRKPYIAIVDKYAKIAWVYHVLVECFIVMTLSAITFSLYGKTLPTWMVFAAVILIEVFLIWLDRTIRYHLIDRTVTTNICGITAVEMLGGEESLSEAMKIAEEKMKLDDKSDQHLS